MSFLKTMFSIYFYTALFVLGFNTPYLLGISDLVLWFHHVS